MHINPCRKHTTSHLRNGVCFKAAVEEFAAKMKLMAEMCLGYFCTD